MISILYFFYYHLEIERQYIAIQFDRFVLFSFFSIA